MFAPGLHHPVSVSPVKVIEGVPTAPKAYVIDVAEAAPKTGVTNVGLLHIAVNRLPYVSCFKMLSELSMILKTSAVTGVVFDEADAIISFNDVRDTPPTTSQLDVLALYHLNTVSTIVSRYAPSIENRTDDYINFVCRYMHTEPGTVLRLDIKADLFPLVEAICKYESNFVPTETMLIDAFLKL